MDKHSTSDSQSTPSSGNDNVTKLIFAPSKSSPRLPFGVPDRGGSPVAPNLQPTSRIFGGDKYYDQGDIAQIIGVSRQAVSKWHTKGLFVADAQAHDGRYLYEIERPEGLKARSITALLISLKFLI